MSDYDISKNEVQKYLTSFKMLLADINYQFKTDSFDDEFSNFDPLVLLFVDKIYGVKIKSSSDSDAELNTQLISMQKTFDLMKTHYPDMVGANWISEVQRTLSEKNRERFIQALLKSNINPGTDRELGSMLLTVFQITEVCESIRDDIRDEKNEILEGKDQLYNSFLGLQSMMEHSRNDMIHALDSVIQEKSKDMFQNVAENFKHRFDDVFAGLNDRIDNFAEQVTPVLNAKVEEFNKSIKYKIHGLTLVVISAFVFISFFLGTTLGMFTQYYPNFRYYVFLSWSLNALMCGIIFGVGITFVIKYSSIFSFFKFKKQKLSIQKLSHNI